MKDVKFLLTKDDNLYIDYITITLELFNFNLNYKSSSAPSKKR